VSEDSIAYVKAVLLVGGLGTRLRAITSSTPKPLAAVGGSPFLELLVRQLHGQGIRRLVLCTGYLGGQIEESFGDGASRGVAIEYSREASPLGTGGAIKNAQPFVEESSDFLVMNGDSFLEMDLGQLVGFHREHGAMMSMAVLQSKNAGRFGTVRMAADGRVTGFLEKTNREEPGVINGGVYVFSRRIFDFMPAGPSSLERDLFPNILDRGIYALPQHGMFIDIGTPDDYARSQQLFDRLSEAAASKS
jgi:NDP-sugar pyrophosphorylase family protein